MARVLDPPTHSGNSSGRPSSRPPLPRLPKDRRSGRNQRSGRKVIRRILVSLIVVIVGVLAAASAAFAYAWSSLTLPPDTTLAQTTYVTDVKGQPLASFNAGENRDPVKIGQVPKVVIDAVVDTEDHDFFQHKGVDPRGLTRAFFNDVRGNSGLQGGSTITQQYVKNAYVGNDVSPIRKAKEAILAMKLERKLSKQEILERYLNTIYFGRGAYGVQTASKAYFNKDVSQLTLKEASYLAGIIRAPELADAYKAPNVAKDRRNATLGSMVRYKTITQQQKDEVNAIDLKSYVTLKAAAGSSKNQGPIGSEYFIDYVKNLLIKQYGETKVETGGLRVKTTLDPDKQTQAYQAIYGYLKPGEPAGALVSLDSSGQIQAMVGGRDYAASQVNLAAGTDGGGTGRQPGSTFKAFALAAAMNQGICFRTRYDAPQKATFQTPSGPWTVSNFTGEPPAGDRIDLIKATEDSVNTVYAQLGLQVGIDNVATMAKQAGITSELQPLPALVLGTEPVSPLEMADAYLTFSQEGMHVDTSAISEVKDADGQTLFKAGKPNRTRVMSAGVANKVNYLLQQVVSKGTGYPNAANVGVPVAGKTGTTSDNGDAWFVGYTPSMATAVWMGYPEGAAHHMDNFRNTGQVTGGKAPASMWANYMRQATKGAKAESFTAPEDCTPPYDPKDNPVPDTGSVTPAYGDGNNGSPNQDTAATDPSLDDIRRQIRQRAGLGDQGAGDGTYGTGGNGNQTSRGATRSTVTTAPVSQSAAQTQSTSPNVTKQTTGAPGG